MEKRTERAKTRKPQPNEEERKRLHAEKIAPPRAEFKQCPERPEGEGHFYQLDLAGEGICKWCGAYRPRPSDTPYYVWREFPEPTPVDIPKGVSL